MARILLIDDDVTLLTALSTALEEEGYNVLKTGDLLHARQIYAEQEPDLVVLEVRSERDRGWQLLTELAAATPVIVLSGAGLEEDIVRGLEAGACDYLTKPYRSRELLARMRARLGVPASPLLVPAGAIQHNGSLAAVQLPAAPLKPAPSPAPNLPVVTAPVAPADPAEVRAPAAPATPADPAEVRAPATPADPAEVRVPVAPAAPAEPAAPPLPDWVTATPPVNRPESRPARPEPPEEKVFISEAEEMALLRETAVIGKAPPRAAIDEPPRTIGQHLRNERLRRQLTLVQIENEIRVRISYLQAMEDDKFTLIPRGPASQQMLKAYAEYLGLDTVSLLDEFMRVHYVDAVQPLPALGGNRIARSLPGWLIWLLAILLAVSLAVGAIFYFDPQFFSLIGERISALWSWIQGLLPAM